MRSVSRVGRAMNAHLRTRSSVLQAVRRFFLDRGFVEVETPVRVRCPAMEPHIDAVAADGWYLRTSPELYIKRLLAQGAERVFEMGPCFRKGERGDRHNPEFTMLEWYRANADYEAVLADARELLPFVLREATGSALARFRGRAIPVDAPWHTVRVRDAFRQFAGWDPFTGFDPDRFDLDMVEKVEPSLPNDRPVVLRDFPAPLAALARCREESPPVAERWELYAGGMELANAFSELNDPQEQRRRFVDCAEKRRRRGGDVYPIDEAFLDSVGRLPPSGGVALGIDRLVMLATGAERIDEVRAFAGDG